MKILVLSCDKNKDLFEPFYHCMEKYWDNHPEIIYSTETLNNPYYKTICKNYPLNQWSKRIRETLAEIDDSQVLIMVDDCFVRRPVDENRIKYACENLNGNIAFMNFEKAFDKNDLKSEIEGFNLRRKGAPYAISIMCGLWDKEKLINILKEDKDPWQIELTQPTCGYDYYINNGDFIIDWGYHTTGVWFGVRRGKWCKECVDFLRNEGIEIDFSKRGVI